MWHMPAGSTNPALASLYACARAAERGHGRKWLNKVYRRFLLESCLPESPVFAKPEAPTICERGQAQNMTSEN